MPFLDPEVTYRYKKFRESFENASLLKIGDEEVDLPNQRSMRNGGQGIEFRDVSVNGSHNLLLEYDDRRAGIRFQTPEDLKSLAVPLTDALRATLCQDHTAYWWFTHDFAKVHAEKKELPPIELVENLQLMIRLVLSKPLPPFTQGHSNEREILHQSKILATYLGYPTLEGFAKFACRRDVKMDGKIREGKGIRKLTPRSVRQFQTPDDGSDICSNLGMLLWHLETEIVRAENEVVMKEMRDVVGTVFDHPSERVYGLLNSFRNDALHGRERATREYGVLLNYICLIIWIILLP